VIEALIGGVVTLGVAGLGFLGVRYTARSARSANNDTVTASEQATAVKAYESMVNTLLVPMENRIGQLEGALVRETKARSTEQAKQSKRIEEQKERIDLLNIQLREWKRLAKVIARWATTLRDQVLTLGGQVPATPEELLLIQSLDDPEL
jgi:predicted RNase H-like nuclease (RuvC/YqgF family)